MYAHVHVFSCVHMCVCHSAHMEVKGQLLGFIFFHVHCVVLNDRNQVSFCFGGKGLPDELSFWPKILFLR